MMTEELNVNRETAVDSNIRIWNDTISTNIVPQILTDQKECHLQISSDFLKNVEVFDRFITRDETLFPV